MAVFDELTAIGVKAKYEDRLTEARNQAKILVFDLLGCAIGALGAKPIKAIREQIKDYGENARYMLIGGRQTAPVRAAFYNSALMHYLAFNDEDLA
jgi:2-methylcitrate dehydratase